MNCHVVGPDYMKLPRLAVNILAHLKTLLVMFDFCSFSSSPALSKLANIVQYVVLIIGAAVAGSACGTVGIMAAYLVFIHKVDDPFDTLFCEHAMNVALVTW